MQEHLNVKQVAEMLNSNVKTIQRKAQRGYYPQGVCGKHGRCWVFCREELLKFIYGVAM